MTGESCPPAERVNILGVGVSAVNLPEAVERIACWVERRQREYVVVCPVYTLMQGFERPDLNAIFAQAGLVTPDGMPLVFLSRRMGYTAVGRVYGPDLLEAFSARAAKRGYRNFYYGGAEGVAEELARTLGEKYPGLLVAGAESPPYRELSEAEKALVAQRINDSGADVVWVGLGSPKQDYWMAEFRARLDAPVLIGVGAAFDFLTGRVPQAPRWMQRAGLEWLYRLLQEPGRLWRRYIIYNPKFLWYVALQRLGLRDWPLPERAGVHHGHAP